MAAIAEETLKALVDAIRERLKPLAVYLFGSQALGQAGPESDLDIAVLGFSPYSPWRLFTLAQELVSCFPIPELDLLDLATAPPSLQARVVTEGRRLFCADPLPCALFEIRALKEYAYLKERLKPLEEEIRRRGRVYG